MGPRYRIPWITVLLSDQIRYLSIGFVVGRSITQGIATICRNPAAALSRIFYYEVASCTVDTVCGVVSLYLALIASMQYLLLNKLVLQYPIFNKFLILLEFFNYRSYS